MTSPQRIVLFYCHKVYASGITAFTAHLWMALKSQGHDVHIFSPTLAPGVLFHDSLPSEPFGAYDDEMRIVRCSPFQAISMASEYPSIIVAPGSPNKLPDPKLMHNLQRKGARVVVHDPTQFKNFAPFDGTQPNLVQRPILVREAMKKYFKDSTFIQHPYVRAKRGRVKRDKFAVSTARLATSKRTRLILQANRELPKRLRIDLRGAGENRMFTHGLENTYGDVFRQPKKPLSYPMTFEAPVHLCQSYRYHVDLTKFEGDGGGTQYAQLEAIDAGCVPIMHGDWFDEDENKNWLKRGTHVYTVGGPLHLASHLKAADAHDYFESTDRILRENGNRLLSLHDPMLVGRMYCEEVGV